MTKLQPKGLLDLNSIEIEHKPRMREPNTFPNTLHPC
jgi:hypothetical protein